MAAQTPHGGQPVAPDPEDSKPTEALPAVTRSGRPLPSPPTVRPPREPDKPRRALPEMVGPYTILEEISRGGMGIVYKARDPSLKRVVAIKVLRAGEGASEEDVRRFQREAQAAARLQHPNIVAIHATGEQDGQPYFVMDFVDGRTVKDLLKEGPLPPRLALSIAGDAAAALDHAAGQGVIHRDVKPANILVDATGLARLMDFGLARRIDEDLDITQSGTTVGTPSYMPPEQAEGKLSEVDAQSDLYALGAVLYEMLTGAPPFEGPTTMAVLRRVLDEEPVPPRRLNPRIHPDIETICLKCLEKEKRRRYASTAELAEDLRRFNAGEPIAAAPISAFTLFFRRVRKNMAVSLTVAGAAFCILAVVAYATLSAVRARRAQESARLHAVETDLARGKDLAARTVQALAGLATSPEEGFEPRCEGIRSTLEEANVAFREALTLAPNSEQAREGLLDTAALRRDLDVARLVHKARMFLTPSPQGPYMVVPPPNYPAAQAFAEEALALDKDNLEAHEVRKKAAGIRTVTIQVPGGSAEVYARLVADAEHQPVPERGAELGTNLGRTPIRDREMSPGVYVLTFRRPGLPDQELTFLVSRDSEPGFVAPLTAPERNMVLIPAGPVQVPAVGVVQAPAFKIDRFEYPNQAGRPPRDNVQTLLEARDLCTSEGKTLCTSVQWLRACQGERTQIAFPYGTSYIPGACATGFDPEAQKSAFRSGWFPRCRTAEGAFDMSGNLSEWTDGDEHDEIIYGGDWTDSVRMPELTISCRARQSPDSAYKKRAGVRCCLTVK